MNLNNLQMENSTITPKAVISHNLGIEINYDPSKKEPGWCPECHKATEFHPAYADKKAAFVQVWVCKRCVKPQPIPISLDEITRYQQLSELYPEAWTESQARH